jgi:hypothetical protein
MIKLFQAATAQKPASSNMAAQALCEPAPSDATTLIHDRFFIGYLKYQISGIRAINYLAPIDIFRHGTFGILALIIQHQFQISCMHIYY